MRIILGQQCQPAEFFHYMAMIEEWVCLIRPLGNKRNELALGDSDNLWLGYSRREKICVLKIITDERPDTSDESSVFAFLIDPPQHNAPATSEILLRARKACVEDVNISEESLQIIVDSVPFPEYQKAGEILPGLPSEWAALPAKINVSFKCSDNCSVIPSMYDYFDRASFIEVLKIVNGERHDGVLLHYSLVSCEAAPLLRWDMDCSLARLYKETYKNREKTSSGDSWEIPADQSLLTLYQFLPGVGFSGAPPYYGKPTVRLKVGGLTKEAANTNWRTCATLLRAINRAEKVEFVQPFTKPV